MVRVRLALAVFLAAVLACAASVTFAKKKNDSDSQTNQQQRAIHALNRLAFGARPGDVERVLSLGVDKWIDQQLRPDKIDDSALEARLAPLRTLKMDNRALLENFPPQPVIKQVADGKLPMPSDPEKRAIYQAQLERYHNQQARKEEGGAEQGKPVQPSDAQMAAGREERRISEQRVQNLLQMAPGERYAQLLNAGSEASRTFAALPPPQRERLLADFTPAQRETALALVNPQQVVVNELQEGKLLRAIYSERQLQEVMTDFWFNHFNVFVGKGADRYMVTGYEREVIRPHALGKFKDLLAATAKSPAMLFYLDNWQSVGPHSALAEGRPLHPARTPRPRSRVGIGCGPFGCYPRAGTRIPAGGQRAPQRPNPAKRNRNGLNENYARELMELHTLGVDGGYTQADVTEVARVFTGWTVREPRQGGEFQFNERMHEPGTKHVLGKDIKEHGEKEGAAVLELLARRPSTARFLSTKLAERFVSDTPPPALVERMAKTFHDSDGDIREVLRTMFHSPEFWSVDAYRAKTRTPLEFVVSAVRATGAEVRNPMPLVQALNRMGMPLYGAQPPTGYSMKAEAWVNSAALLERMNFALALAAGRMPGLGLNDQELLAAYHIAGKHQVASEPSAPVGADALLRQLEGTLLGGEVSRQTHATIEKRLAERHLPDLSVGAAPADVALVTGLILGSPEFQKR